MGRRADGANMTFGSLFAGIGGFDLAFERAGMECRWQVEIDNHAIKVLMRHWPNVQRFRDVRACGKCNLEPVDVICAGFPCQGLSAIGKHAGLADTRSGLWYELERIISEMLPSYVVIENVPGLLSSNGGADIQLIIDSLTQIGYVVDIDIKNAQEFGVAQHRRRVFLVCVRLDALLRRRTSLSRQISGDLFMQVLLNTWGAIPPILSLVPLHSVYHRPMERCIVLLSKMMGLFKTTLERLAHTPSRSIWDVLLGQFGDADGLSTSTSLSDALSEGCRLANESITSTWTQGTINRKIFIFVAACLDAITLIIPYLDWSVNHWNVAQSVSILLQENMNYVREASSQLFIEPGLRDSWRHYLNAASSIMDEFEHRIGDIPAAQILSESKGSTRRTQASKEMGHELVPSVA